MQTALTQVEIIIATQGKLELLWAGSGTPWVSTQVEHDHSWRIRKLINITNRTVAFRILDAIF